MIHFTDEDIQKWSKAVAEAGTKEAMEAITKKIWEDGYRTAEAEITYSNKEEQNG